MIPRDAKKFIKKILRESSFNDIKSKKKTFAELEPGVEDLNVKIDEFDYKSIVDKNKKFLAANTLFKESNNEGLIVNGWMLGPFEENETFFDSDFSLLENFILKIGLKQIRDLIPKWRLNVSSQKYIKLKIIIYINKVNVSLFILE